MRVDRQRLSALNCGCNNHAQGAYSCYEHVLRVLVLVVALTLDAGSRMADLSRSVQPLAGTRACNPGILLRFDSILWRSSRWPYAISYPQCAASKPYSGALVSAVVSVTATACAVMDAFSRDHSGGHPWTIAAIPATMPTAARGNSCDRLRPLNCPHGLRQAPCA